MEIGKSRDEWRKKGGEGVEYYFKNKNGINVVATKEDRIEHLKNLSKKLREELSKDTETLFPDEIDYFISIFKAELEHVLINGGKEWELKNI